MGRGPSHAAIAKPQPGSSELGETKLGPQVFLYSVIKHNSMWIQEFLTLRFSGLFRTTNNQLCNCQNIQGLTWRPRKTLSRKLNQPFPAPALQTKSESLTNRCIAFTEQFSLGLVALLPFQAESRDMANFVISDL